MRGDSTCTIEIKTYNNDSTGDDVGENCIHEAGNTPHRGRLAIPDRNTIEVTIGIGGWSDIEDAIIGVLTAG